MRKRLVVSVVLAMFAGLAGSFGSAHADDSAVTTTVTGEVGGRTMTVVDTTLAVTIALDVNRTVDTPFVVEVSEVAATGTDWEVSIGLCGADSSDATITALNREIDCTSNELTKADKSTGVSGTLQSTVSGSLTAVEVAGVLNACPTSAASNGTLSAADNFDQIFDLVTCTGELSSQAYTALYTYAGDYRLDLSDFHELGDFFGYLVFTLVQ